MVFLSKCYSMCLGRPSVCAPEVLCTSPSVMISWLVVPCSVSVFLWGNLRGQKLHLLFTTVSVASGKVSGTKKGWMIFMWMRELIYPATGQRKLGQLVAMLLKINVSKTFASLRPYLSSLERFPSTKQPKYMCYHTWEEISILQNSPIWVKYQSTNYWNVLKSSLKKTIYSWRASLMKNTFLFL